MKIHTIYSENPTKDVWTRLLGYCHQRNLAAVSASRGTRLGPTEAGEVTAALRHSYEYFRAGADASPHTSPVHLYYGMVSLLRAASIVISGRCDKIQQHGMTVPDVSAAHLSDLELITDGAQNGGLIVYFNALHPGLGIVGGLHWALKDLIGSIPDCYDEHIACYGSGAHRFCVPIERVITSNGHHVDRISLADVPAAPTLLERVPRFMERYLQPNLAEGYIVFRERLKAIGDIATTGLSGRRFLQLTHEHTLAASGKPLVILLPELMSTFMAMFILCSLSRYHPVIWMNFNSNVDEHKDLVDHFIRIAARRFPNLILDIIEDRHNVFTGSRPPDLDLRQFAVHDEVKNIVNDATREMLSRITERSIR